MRSSLSGRSWGDGHTDRPRHIILDIQFGEHSSALRCSDAVLQAPTPEALEALWVKHGGKSTKKDAEDRRPDDGEVWSDRTLAIIRFMGKDCTCTPDSDVRDCPNFLFEDSEELPEDDE